jgi:hypothetical protein
MTRKKDVEGNWTETRICGDYRPHNEKTVPDKYPMPVADELFDDLGGSDCFSTLDLRMGYHQIRIRDGDQYKLAFWGHDDLYMPLRLPFGPKNGPAVFAPDGRGPNALEGGRAGVYQRHHRPH